MSFLLSFITFSTISSQENSYCTQSVKAETGTGKFLPGHPVVYELDSGFGGLGFNTGQSVSVTCMFLGKDMLFSQSYT